MGWVKQVFACIHKSYKYVYLVQDAEDDGEYLAHESETKGVE